MKSVITKLLEKRGIENIKDLSSEEKQTFDNWQEILSKEELTLEDVKNFCRNQVEVIENKWADYNIEQTKKSEFIPYHTVYKAILKAIESPKVVRMALEQQLNQLLK